MLTSRHLGLFLFSRDRRGHDPLVVSIKKLKNRKPKNLKPVGEAWTE